MFCCKRYGVDKRVAVEVRLRVDELGEIGWRYGEVLTLMSRDEVRWLYWLGPSRTSTRDPEAPSRIAARPTAPASRFTAYRPGSSRAPSSM